MGRGHLGALAVAIAVAAAALAGPATATTIEPRRLARGAMPSDGTAPPAALVRTKTDAARVGAELRSSDARKLVGVDFRSRAAVAAFHSFGSCGYEIFVVSVARVGATIRVHVGTRSPSPGAVVCQSLTTAYDVVTVPRAAVAGATRVVLRRSS